MMHLRIFSMPVKGKKNACKKLHRNLQNTKVNKASGCKRNPEILIGCCTTKSTCIELGGKSIAESIKAARQVYNCSNGTDM
jgi:hypothetical protein